MDVGLMMFPILFSITSTNNEQKAASYLIIKYKLFFFLHFLCSGKKMLLIAILCLCSVLPCMGQWSAGVWLMGPFRQDMDQLGM